MTPVRRRADAGLTLVEMLVALVLFVLVGLASFTMLDAIIKARDRTEGRLAGIAQLDRALMIFSRDLGQSLAGRGLQDGVLEFSLIDGGTVIEVAYLLQDSTLIRRIQTDNLAVPLEQTLIGGIAAARFRFLHPAGNWTDLWPRQTHGQADLGGPVAVEMVLALATGNNAGPGGDDVRRIVELPRDAAR